MSPDEIKGARRELGFSTSQMAEWLGLELPNGERRIRDWESGRLPISGPAKRALIVALELKALVLARREGAPGYQSTI